MTVNWNNASWRVIEKREYCGESIVRLVSAVGFIETDWVPASETTLEARLACGHRPALYSDGGNGCLLCGKAR